MTTHVIIGVTGNVGSRLARRLAGSGEHVRGVSRNPSGFRGDGVQLFAADVTDPLQAAEAVAGADTVYLTLPEGDPDPLVQERQVGESVIRAAADAGVRHVMMHTVFQGERGDTGARILDNKTPIEQMLASSGVGYTILRPGWFFQNLWGARGYLEHGMLSFPWPGDLAWGGVDVEDIARAAHHLLASEATNRGFDLHVPGGVTGNEIARAARRVLGRQVQYQQFPGSAREAVEPYPIDDSLKPLYAELFEYFRHHSYVGDTSAITEAVPGFEYRSIEDFLSQELFPRP